MFRIRITLMTALVFALAAVAINSQAQPPPGGQRGGRGQRGGGPGGGRARGVDPADLANSAAT